MNEQQEPIFGSKKSYHLVSYKKSPFVQYQNFFSIKIVNTVLSRYGTQLRTYRDDESVFQQISILDNFSQIDNSWIIKPIWSLVEDANNTNFLFNVTHIQFANLLKFKKHDSWQWHQDCKWFFDGLPFDKKLTIIVELNNYTDYTGGSYGCYMNTVPIPDNTLTLGTVTIFPSFIRYNVSKILEGEKKILVLYAVGPKFR